LKELNEQQLNKWMKGFKQIEEKKKNIEENNLLKNEPLARYEIDNEVDLQFKQKARFGDPMKELINYNLIGNQEKNKEKFNEMISQTKNSVDVLKEELEVNNTKIIKNEKRKFRKCKFNAPVNRYEIEAGYICGMV